MRAQIRCSLLFFLCALAVPLAAQEALYHSGSRITVTASRIPVKDKKNPVKVTVLDKKAIETSGARSLSELVNQALPLYVKDSPGMTGSLWINGMKADDTGVFVSSRILILVNGHPAGTGILDSIPVFAVKRIEVISGPMSVAYGSGAIGGVINIITEKNAFLNQAGMSLKAGDYDYWGSELLLSLKGNDFQLFAAAGYETQGEYSIGSFRFSKARKYDLSAPLKVYRNTDYDNQKGYLGFTYALGENELLEGSFHFFQAEAGAPGSFLDNDLNDIVKMLRYSADLGYKKFLKDGEWGLQGYLNFQNRDNYGFAPSPVFDFHQTLLEGGFGSYMNKKWNLLDLVGGFNASMIHLEKKGSAYSEPQTSYYTGGVFGEMGFEAQRDLHLYAAGRFDLYYALMGKEVGIEFDDTKKGRGFSQFSYRAGLSYFLLEYLPIKIFAGTGYVAPSLMQLAGDYSGPFGSGITKEFKGNPDLKAETSYSYQLTTGYMGLHRILITYAYQRSTNTITADYGDPITYINKSGALFRSMELEASINWGVYLPWRGFNGRLEIKSAHNLEYRDLDTNQSIEQVYVPRDKVVGNLLFGFEERFLWNFSYQWVGELIDGASYNDIGNIHILNTTMTIQPFEGDALGGIKVSLVLKNLLDYEYENVDNYPQPGRSYQFALSYRLSF